VPIKINNNQPLAKKAIVQKQYKLLVATKSNNNQPAATKQATVTKLTTIIGSKNAATIIGSDRKQQQSTGEDKKVIKIIGSNKK